MQTRHRYFRPMFILLLCITILVSLFFLIAPEWDIYLSGIFADGKNGFPMNGNVALENLRWFYMVEMLTIFLTASIMVFFARAHADKVKIPARFWDFLIGSYILGPLILVNLIFKSHWGRPRPAQIEEFGGPWNFTPPYYISNQCQLNCSFVSGEGSAIATGGILLGFIIWHMFPNLRRTLLLLIAGMTMLGVGLRYIKGKHFMSDSLLAVLFCAIIILLLHRFLDLSKAHQCLNYRNLKQDILLAVRSVRQRAI